MIMNKLFVVDTNCLIAMKNRWDLVRNYKQIVLLDCVEDEYKGVALSAEMCRVSVSSTTLKKLPEVFRCAMRNKAKIVDLFKLQGGCDPILIAYILDEIEKRDGSLIDFLEGELVLVTEDREVRKVASGFDITVFGFEEFLSCVSELK